MTNNLTQHVMLLMIMHNILSKTIDDFKNFIRGDRIKTSF